MVRRLGLGKTTVDKSTLALIWRKGWSGGTKVLCILRHWGIQLILAYSWERPAILVAGKGRGGMFLFLLFLHFHSCFFFISVPLFHFYYLFYLLSPFLLEMTQNDPQATVAQFDAPSNWRPGGHGFNPCPGRQHSFVEIDHEIFSMVILSLPLIQEGQLSVSGERMCTILVNRLED